jgi:predicted O-methyltransferase YrrM
MSYNYFVDWSKASTKNIKYIFDKYITHPKSTMEIGVFEGRTTFWMINSYPSINRHVAIDPFRGNYEVDETILDIVKDRFLDNLSQCPQNSKIEFHESKSVDVLNLLNERFDFIYIDGDHTASSVLEDIVRCFQLIRPGGVILLDDATRWKYTKHSTKEKSGDPSLAPRMAIDAFIHCNWNRIEVLDIPDSSQVAILKI